MESSALPLARGSVDVTPLSPGGAAWSPRMHVSSAQTMQGRDQQEALLMRRVSSYQGGNYFGQNRSLLPRQDSRGGRGFGAITRKKSVRHSYGSGGNSMPFTANDSFFAVTSRALTGTESGQSEPLHKRVQSGVVTALVNLTSGVIAFLLSSTLAVSCASVVVGHGTPLATVIADFIDMNLLGTAVLCVVLAWKSRAPWTLGSIDVFVYVARAFFASRVSSSVLTFCATLLMCFAAHPSCSPWRTRSRTTSTETSNTRYPRRS